MPGPAPAAPKERPCLDAVKKVYAAFDVVHDVTNSELDDEERATVLILLTEAGATWPSSAASEKLVDRADGARMQVVQKAELTDIQTKVGELKKVAKEEWMKSLKSS